MAFAVLGTLPGARVRIDDLALRGGELPGLSRHLARASRGPDEGRGDRDRRALRPPASPAPRARWRRRSASRISIPASLYRGVTLVALREAARRGRSSDDPLEIVGAEAILRAAEDRGLMLQPDGAGFAAYLEGEPVDAEIRGAEVTARVSAVSAVPVVREWINSRLRAMVRAGRDVVVDGRDIGTVVFPDAELKIFLTASPEARAGRRLTQRGGAMDAGGVEAETAALAARDAADSTRAVAPLAAARRRRPSRYHRA